MNNPESSTLGQATVYVDQYDPSLLFPIPRLANRQAIGIDALPFKGFDRWTHFEVSWLNAKGKPQVAIANLIFNCESPNIIESKSLKLYFNSFNQTKMASVEAFVKILEKDLSAASGLPVSVDLVLPQSEDVAFYKTNAQCIDEHDVEINDYHVTPSILKTADHHGRFHVCSHLLRSNCPVTNQPDWATVEIAYEGNEIDEAALLKYIISYRLHNGFHEECVERIFYDINAQCQPEKLAVIGRFTRRGGLDINPVRANFEFEFDQARTQRQ